MIDDFDFLCYFSGVDGNSGYGGPKLNVSGSLKRYQPWTFLTNHAHVLLCIFRSPLSLMRDLATEVGITERAVQRIIADLKAAGYLQAERQGRRNRYRVKTNLFLRHPIEHHRTVASLVDLIFDSGLARGTRASGAAGTGGTSKRPARLRKGAP